MDSRVQSIFDQLEQIAPTEIMARLNIVPQKMKHVGVDHYKCLCPFPGHQDTNVGSFDVNDGKRIAKCFACQKGGRPIRFFRDLSGLTSDYVAGIQMGGLFGLFSADEVDHFLRDRTYDVITAKTKDPSYKKPLRNYKKEPPMQPLDVRSAFYEAFTSHLPLTPKDRFYLMTRGIQESELSEFFGYSDKFRDGPLERAFYETQKDLGWESSRYIGIPGIFRVTSFDEPEYLRVTARKRCLGLKILNVDGRVVGLQFRNYDLSANGERYFWFSSSFANEERRASFHDGRSGDAPAGFQRSTSKDTLPVIGITEGKFKAMAMARIGINSFTVQGVGQWKSVIPELTRYYELYPDKPKHVYVAFDVDQKSNGAVAVSSLALYQYLVDNGFTVVYLDWDSKKGKGIDDALENHAEIIHIPGEEYIKTYIQPLLAHQEEERRKRRESLFKNLA